MVFWWSKLAIPTRSTACGSQIATLVLLALLAIFSTSAALQLLRTG
jgi:hypothetical protein